MSTVRELRRRKIPINGGVSISIVEEAEDCYVWNKVTVNYGNEEIYIGSYYTCNGLTGREWMSYNHDFIFLMRNNTDGYGTSNLKVDKLFDIQSRQFISDDQQALIKRYKGICKKK